MNLKNTTNEYILMKAFSQSEKERCEYVLIKNALAFLADITKGAEAIKLLKENGINFSDISFREDEEVYNITFCISNLADRSLLKDREKEFSELKEKRWACLLLSDEELEKLNPTSVQMFLTISIVFIKDGYFFIEAKGEEPEDVFSTEMYHIEGFLNDDCLTEAYRNKVKKLFHWK